MSSNRGNLDQMLEVSFASSSSNDHGPVWFSSGAVGIMSSIKDERGCLRSPLLPKRYRGADVIMFMREKSPVAKTFCDASVPSTSCKGTGGR